MEPSVIEIEKQRLVLSYEEKLALARATNYVKNRLLEQKMRERELQWRTKETELHDNEIATLNILEDARALEEELEKQKNHLNLIIASMGEGLLLINEAFRITLINEKAAALLGIRPEDAQGKDVRKLIVAWQGDERLTGENRPATLAFAKGKPITATVTDNYYYQTAGREKFPISFTIAPLTQEEEVQNIIIVFRDITEEKALDEARTNFISLASHQLRTPLTAVKWYTELLMDKGMGTLTELQTKFAQQILMGANRLGETINLLLSLARIEGKALEINPKPIQIVDFAKTVIGELAPLAKKEGVSLILHEPLPSLPIISFDPAMLHEVMANLLVNAIRYSWKDETVTISLSAGEKEATVAIADNGIGIPAAVQGRVYEKFFRADNATKKVSGGTGLGLPLVRSLISLWGGKIWFTSQEGKGTTFYFTVPYEGLKETRKGKPLA